MGGVQEECHKKGGGAGVGGEGRGKEEVTSSVSDPKSRRSNGMAATRSIINQPLDDNKLTLSLLIYYVGD